MSTKTVQKTALRALALSLAISSCFALAKDFTEKDFQSQPLGHGVYELSYDKGQQAICSLL